MITVPPPQPRARPRRIRYTLPPIPATAYYYAVGLITGAAASGTLALLIR